MQAKNNPTIYYTLTDEAPLLATYSLLPIIKRFTKSANIEVIPKDISLSGRILAAFSSELPPQQRVENSLSFLGELSKTPWANIIKLPNISASIPQLLNAIKELQNKGFAVPDYPQSPKNEKEQQIKAIYDSVKGSAVNPVLREGNSDRRAPISVKNYARKNPHSMGAWDASSKTEVSTMFANDFKHSEVSVVIPSKTTIRIELHSKNGEIVCLKDNLALQTGEIIDASVMSRKVLYEFLKAQIADAKRKGILFSIHLKATMMKVSDPIIFGEAIKAYLAPVFESYHTLLDELQINPNDGLAAILDKLNAWENPKKTEILASIEQCLEQQPIAMVNSDKGITNLHVPSDVIIDASIPAMIRTSGKMYNAKGQLQDAKVVIPDSSYAGIYKTIIEFCKKHGAFDPTTMGSVPNVGLMAQQAEEYGSHDKTFEIPSDGVVKVIDNQGNELITHHVDKGDIWRMCQTKDAPIQDWVKLAIKRAELTNTPAVFWLDISRGHDAAITKKVVQYLSEFNKNGAEIHILSPEEAMRYTLERLKAGKDTISVTGNVLRDYLTDLFPILELGTSAKMLSIVPLINGGGLFETGAGGSAPKLVEQFFNENHLRWDSLGEFLALAASLEHLANTYSNSKASVLAKTLDTAIENLLSNNIAPSRNAGETDNRDTHFYLALFWAEALTKQKQDTELANEFASIANQLKEKQTLIESELKSTQGKVVNVDGYYAPSAQKLDQIMRPSETLNSILK